MRKFKVLSNGIKIPSIGFGTYKSGDNNETAEIVKYALECGYRQTAKYPAMHTYKSVVVLYVCDSLPKTSEPMHATIFMDAFIIFVTADSINSASFSSFFSLDT